MAIDQTDPTLHSDLADRFAADAPNRPAIDAMLQGYAPGVLLYDGEHALLRSDYSFTFLSEGAPQSFLDASVRQLSRERSIALIWSPAEAARLDFPLPPSGITERNEYRSRQGPVEGEGATRIDAELFERCVWKDDIARSVGGAENFLRDCHGYCVLDGDTIASEAYAVFRGDGVFEIGIVTRRSHRGGGFAGIACRAVIAACEAEGMRTYWSCNRSNYGSNRLAEKLGFADRREYQFLVF